jgi:hypothetical protein
MNLINSKHCENNAPVELDQLQITDTYEQVLDASPGRENYFSVPFPHTLLVELDMSYFSPFSFFW